MDIRRSLGRLRVSLNLITKNLEPFFIYKDNLSQMSQIWLLVFNYRVIAIDYQFLNISFYE